MSIYSEEMMVRITPINPSSNEQNAGAGAELGRKLVSAARAGQTLAVRELLASGAPFSHDWLGRGALHAAAGAGQAHTCGVLLRGGALRDARTKVERTALHMACSEGHLAAAKALLDHGATVDCRDMLQMTPLHWACERGHLAVARLLLGAGASLSLRSRFNKTPRALALRRGRLELVELLDQAERERSAQKEMAIEDQEIQTIQAVDSIQTNPLEIEEPVPKVKIEPSAKPKFASAKPKTDEQAAAQALLLRHGIALLPADDGGTLLSALAQGRSVVLSDAGKLILRDSQAASPAKASAGPRVSLPAAPPPGPPSQARLLPAKRAAGPLRIVVDKRQLRAAPAPAASAAAVPKPQETPEVECECKCPCKRCQGGRESESEELQQAREALKLSKRQIQLLNMKLLGYKQRLANYEHV